MKEIIYIILSWISSKSIKARRVQSYLDIYCKHI